MAMNLSELNNLDMQNVGSWPLAVKVVAIVILCAGVLGLGYYLDTQNQLNELSSVQRKEQDLKDRFKVKQAKAANLAAYTQQMKEMKQSFGTMLRQLPSKTEVADLLVDITQTGLASGLQFNLFKPQSEVPKEFYAELPIKLEVIGSYHELGKFVSGVAALPRIVTLHDISIKRDKGSGGRLVMDATAKTYRYLDEQEIAAQRKAEKKKGRRRR